MSSILFLTSHDFTITGKGEDKQLTTQISGLSLILFYSPNCKYCTDVVPIFKQLPSLLNGCQFGIINVNTNKEIIEMSKDTTSPLTYVPFIVIYYKGEPYWSYSGPPTVTDIKNFIVEIAQKISKENKMQFMEKEADKTRKNKLTREYCIGEPLCGEDGVCYLQVDEKQPI
jgi:thioredoxin-like negative regulator of GroEL